MVLAQLEVPMETVEHLAHICTREGVPLMLDPAPAMPLPSGLLQQVTWLTPNETEAAFYIEQAADSPHVDSPADIARSLIATGAQQVVLKLGSRGAFVASGSQAGTRVPSFLVKAVDTTAAGDCFNGAFAVGLMMGKSPVDSARFAAAAAAISVTRAGAQPSMPALPEVEEMLHQKDSLVEAR
jgi:ribokinase